MPVIRPLRAKRASWDPRIARTLLVQEPPIHDAHRADGDDLVAVGGESPAVSVSNTV